jgi:hypothetical protein
MRREASIAPPVTGMARRSLVKRNGSFWSKWWRDGNLDSRIRQRDLTATVGAESIAVLYRLFQKSIAQSIMASCELSPLFAPLINQIVVVDLRSPYVCLGTLVNSDEQFLELRDADLHDFRDSPATRENYVYDSVRLGIRRNRSRVLVRQDEVVAVTRFGDIAAS